MFSLRFISYFYLEKVNMCEHFHDVQKYKTMKYITLYNII